NKRKLDLRGSVARLWKRRTLEWAADAGGLEYLSSREQTLLWHTAALSLMVESILTWALAQPSLLDQNREMLAPLRKSLIAYLNAERRGLEALGLKPARPERPLTLQEYIASKATSAPTMPPARQQQRTAASLSELVDHRDECESAPPEPES